MAASSLAAAEGGSQLTRPVTQTLLAWNEDQPLASGPDMQRTNRWPLSYTGTL